MEGKMLYSGKDLRKLIIPLIIEQILAIAVGMADTIMVSAAGEAAVSGVSLVDTVNILLINVFSALADLIVRHTARVRYFRYFYNGT